jgi:hypothetical protein
VVFEEKKAKGVLMSNLKRLAIADDTFKQLRVAHDGVKIHHHIYIVLVKNMFFIYMLLFRV